MASDAAAAEGNAATGDGGAPVDLLIAAVPAVGALGAMAIAYWVYHFSRPAGQGKKRRRRRRQPTKNEYQTRTSHLDTSGSVLAAWETTPSDSMLDTSKFAGFYDLFLMLMLYYIAANCWTNYQHTGHVFADRDQQFQVMVQYLPYLAVSVFGVYFLSFSAFVLHRLVVAGYVRGVAEVVLQHCLQALLIFGAVYLATHPTADGWPLTQRLALLLQTMVSFMKMHSYTMTNRELRNAKAAGVHLTAGVQDPPSTAAETPETAAPETAENSDSEEEVGGRPTTPAPTRSNGTTSGDAVAQHTRSHDAVAAASNRRVETLANVRDSGVDTSSDEAAVVHSQAYLHAVAQYPANATLRNWVYFTLVPTVCYEPEYPRSPSFRIRYFLEKVFLAAALVMVGLLMMSQYIKPVLSRVTELNPVEAILSLIIPFTTMWLLTFFIIFECILNAAAEMTRFGDRQFYADWWNSTTFDEFARKWNKPVHEFLLRHVYLESMRTYKMSKAYATGATFVFSILLHELVLATCFEMVRPWFSVFGLTQLPLIPLMRLPMFRGKRLGNLVFWWGIITGIPLMGVLYAREYCMHEQC